MFSKGGAQLAIFFWRQIDYNRAVYASLFGGFSEIGIAHMMDGIAIAHNDDGCGVITFAKLCRHFEDCGQSRARCQAPQSRLFNGRAICGGVGKGHAQFDNIHAVIRQGIENGL